MDSERLKRFTMVYLAIIMPVLLMAIAIISGAGVLYFLLLLAWLGAGILLVFLPTNPERNGQ